jgi:hypothetical protein
MDEWNKARKRPATPGLDEQLRQELVDMTQDVQKSGEEARSLRTQLANALTVAARAAPTAPQAPEDRGKKFLDSTDLSGLVRTRLKGWIAPLWMVIQHKCASFPDKKLKMHYAINCLRGIA